MTDTQPESTDATAPKIPRTKEKLDELASAAALQYKLKNWSSAAELYADASEIQAELNGELAPENAELLFLYGRALFKVGLQKSDVLGNKVAQEDKNQPKAPKKAKKPEATNGGRKGETVESKPFFQLTGDENWTDSEDEEEDAEGGEGEEEEDDLSTSFEIFEMARVCYEKQLDAVESANDGDKGKGKAELSPQSRAIKDKLADCHGFLAEISLENERFHDAIEDARKALALQEELHPLEHENVSEAHYMLSLALELASVHKAEDGPAATEEGPDSNGTGKPQSDAQEIDYALREDAAKHTELAIQSVEARLEKAEAVLAGDTLTAEQRKETEILMKDKKGALEDLKNRVRRSWTIALVLCANLMQLTDLKTDPKAAAFDTIDPSLFQGLMGGLLGSDPSTVKAKLEEASKSAKDISGLVKTRKKEKPVAAGEGSSGKRKLEVQNEEANGKRAKTEDP